MTDAKSDSRVDRLLDAIDFIKADQREEGRRLLRQLIGEDNDFEAAWLWMSVTVDRSIRRRCAWIMRCA